MILKMNHEKSLKMKTQFECKNTNHKPEHRTNLAMIRVKIPAQLRAVDKFLDPKIMGLADTAYAGLELVKDTRYREGFGASKMARALATLDKHFDPKIMGFLIGC